MNKILIAVAISAAFAGQAFAAPAALVTGTTSVNSSVNGQSYAPTLGGSSNSGAESLQSSTLNVYANTNIPGGNANGAQTATIGAVGSTASTGFAYNLSTGNAIGYADMSGNATQQAAGSATTSQVGIGLVILGNVIDLGNGPFIPAGSAGGNETSTTTQVVVAGTNQGAAVGSVSGGNFGADVGFTTNNAPVQEPAGGNTTVVDSGNGVQLTAGSIGGSYAQTLTTDGVYANGTAVDFGGLSNMINVGAPTLVNTATGEFNAGAQIGAATNTQ
jgi:hypothetical protein